MRTTRMTARDALIVFALAATFAACAVADRSVTDPGTGSLPDSAVANPALGSRTVFPADNPWNTDISAQSVDPASATLLASCGVRNLHPDFGAIYGIPYVLVGSGTARKPVSFDYA